MAYGRGVSYHDLEFKQVAVLRHSTRGVPFTKWVDVGMPAIPSTWLNCVVYLYRDVASAEKGTSFGGSGFIVGVPSTTLPNAYHHYLVSNYHAAVEKGYSVARVNTLDGRTDAIDYDPSDWTWIPNGGDVAVAPFPSDVRIHKFNAIAVGTSITQQESSNRFMAPGDDVFMVGRFVDHDGGQTNIPAVRFGNISIDPTPLPEIKNSDASIAYYCLDMHSRTGFSGSPVFAYRTPGSDLKDAFSHSLNIGPPVMRLLGIHCGQFPEDMFLKGDEDNPNARPIVGYSGMTYALPAWNIVDVLNLQKFIDARAEVDARWKGVNFPREE